MGRKVSKFVRICVDTAVALQLAASVALLLMTIYNFFIGEKERAVMFCAILAAVAGTALLHMVMINTADSRTIVSALGATISALCLYVSMQVESQTGLIVSATILALCGIILLYSIITHAVKIAQEKDNGGVLDVLCDIKHSLPVMLMNIASSPAEESTECDQNKDPTNNVENVSSNTSLTHDANVVLLAS